MMRLSGLIAVFLGVMLSFAVAESAQEKAGSDQAADLNRDIMACRQKAVDLRVLGLNALKNADAARTKTYNALIEAMGRSENAAEIDLARDLLDESCRNLEGAADEVGDMIAYVLKAEMSLKKADAAAKSDSEEPGASDKIDLRAVRKQIKSAHHCLEEAAELAVDLKREWLEPFFISTSTTTSTTTTTTAPGAAVVVKP